jgi:hypothetical protein
MSPNVKRNIKSKDFQIRNTPNGAITGKQYQYILPIFTYAASTVVLIQLQRRIVGTTFSYTANSRV